MTSNKLSQRRPLLKRPIVCKKAPPPLPPPAPPPPPWPADVFPLHLVASWMGYGGPVNIDRTEDLTLDPSTWHWQKPSDMTPDDQYWTFLVNPVLHTAELNIMTCSNYECATSSKYNIPINWGVFTSYSITSWDSYYPGDLIQQADFVF